MSQEITIGETTYNLEKDLKEIKDKIDNLKNLAPVSSAPQQVQVPQAQGMFTQQQLEKKIKDRAQAINKGVADILTSYENKNKMNEELSDQIYKEIQKVILNPWT